MFEIDPAEYTITNPMSTSASTQSRKPMRGPCIDAGTALRERWVLGMRNYPAMP